MTDKNYTDELKSRLESSHVIHILLSEHEQLLFLLDELERLNEEFKTGKFDSYQDVSDKVREIINHLLKVTDSSESHYRREEEILFPQLGKLNLLKEIEQDIRTGHPEIVEHKNRITALQWNINHENFSQVRKQIIASVSLIITQLREFITLENNKLYPLAVDKIKDEKVWEELKEACDAIGYCSSITPITEAGFTRIAVF